MNRAIVALLILAACGHSDPGADSKGAARSEARESSGSAREVAHTIGPTELTEEEFRSMGALPPPIVGPFCAGKLHSGGCVPGLEWTGVPSVTSPDAFVVRATRIKPNVPGFVFYGNVATQTPYQGGMLCVGGTVHRLPEQDSGGSGACGGSIQYDFNSLIRSGTDASLVAGAKVFCQIQFRDDSDPAGFGTGYSHALQFIIQP